MLPQNPAVVAWIGLDWADQEHQFSLQAADSQQVERGSVRQAPEALEAWMQDLRRRFPMGSIALAVEQSRGALLYALMKYDFLLLYPVPPKMAADYRKTFSGSGAKSDPRDGDLLLELLRCHHDRLRVWWPDDAETRHLALLVEHRRHFVDQCTGLTNELTSLLKESYPQALEWAGELNRPAAAQFLLRWPSLTAAQQARPADLRRFYRAHGHWSMADLERRLDQIRSAVPLTTDPAVLATAALMVTLFAQQLLALLPAIAQLDQTIAKLFPAHPDYQLWDSFPGAGPVLAPRLLAAFGADRERYTAAAEMEQFSGIAPVTESSGQRCRVHWRWACPKFLRQSFHEFAGCSVPRCGWAKAYYEQQRQRGKGHHAALRALAFKWIRILYRCWKEKTPYSEERYLRALARRGSPLVARMAIPQPKGA
jgi:transposase